jgi:TM2 domain-containing membrane protein YozV
VLPPGPPPAWGAAPAAWTIPAGQATPAAGWAAPDGPAFGGQPKDRLAAAALALVLGGVGAHKFYLGRTGQGIVYLLLFWTGIPAFLAWIEGIMYLARSDESWAAEYGGPPQRPSSSASAACG